MFGILLVQGHTPELFASGPTSSNKFIAKFIVDIPSSLYWRTVWEQVAADGFIFRYIPNDFIQGISKPFVFGGIISITACYFGLNTTGGTEGVGQSTTRTVVTSSIMILIVDYFLTQLLLSVLTT